MMENVIERVVAAGLVLLLLLAAGLVAKKFQHLQWRSANTVSATVFLAGAGAVAGWFVPASFLLLLPVWLCAAAVGVVHLLVAQAHASRTNMAQPVPAQVPSSAGRPPQAPASRLASAPCEF